jgi:hypothetical protein
MAGVGFCFPTHDRNQSRRVGDPLQHTGQPAQGVTQDQTIERAETISRHDIGL